MFKWKRFLTVAAAFAAVGSLVAAPATATEEEMFQQFEKIKNKKVLLCQAWTDRTPDVVVKNIDLLKQYFDGVFVEIYGRGHKDPKGETASSRRALQKDFEFKYEWFAGEVPKIKKFTSNGLKESFIGTCVRYGDLDWFNDKHWQIACNNFGVMAKIAKEGGMKGIAFDAEMYAFKQFNYQPYCGKSRHQIWMKARERGKQWITEVQKNYPGITIFCLFLHSLNYELLGTADNNAYAQGNLFVAFFNGMLDGLDPATRLIEGNEYYTYRAKSRRHFDYALAQERMLFNSQVLPENRTKAKAQIAYAPAIYMDAYFAEPKKMSAFHRTIYDIMTPGLAWNDPKRMEAFYRNFAEAVRSSDEYVWLYQEKVRYFGRDKKYIDNQLMQEAFPQLLPYIKAAKSPASLEKYWLERVKAEKVPNLVKGGDFESDAYKKWYFWQRTKNKHKESGFFIAPGMGVNKSRCIIAKNLGKSGGSFFVKNIKVKPNTQYMLYGKIKRTEAGYGALSIMFQQGNAWDYNTFTPLIKIAPRTMKAGEFEEVTGVFTMPEYIDTVGVALSTGEQRNRHDFIYFDEIGLYELPTR